MIPAIVASIWILTCGIFNALKPRIPNKVIVAGAILATIFRLADWIDTGIEFNELVALVVCWGIALLFWFLGLWGGGDAKFLMVVTLAFPDLLMLVFMLGVDIFIIIVFVLFESRLNLIKWRSYFQDRNNLDNTKHTIRAITWMSLGWFLWFLVR